MDPLLNPAAVLLGGQVCEKNLELAQNFVTWIVDPEGGQAVVQKPGTSASWHLTARQNQSSVWDGEGSWIPAIFWMRFGIVSLY